MSEKQRKFLNDLILNLNRKLQHCSSIKSKLIIVSELAFLNDFITDNELDIDFKYDFQSFFNNTKLSLLTVKEDYAFKENYDKMYQSNLKISALGDSLVQSFGLKHFGFPQKKLKLVDAQYLVEIFLKQYDKDIYSFYKSLIKSDNIFVFPLETGTVDSTFSFPTEELSIVYYSNKNTIETALTIVHETIHAYINSFHYNSTLEQVSLQNINNLQEVYTETIELFFLDFASKINYDKKDIIKIQALTNFLMMKDLTEYNKILASFEAEDITSNEKVYLEFLEHECYSYGKVMSKHYYDLYQSDPMYAKENLLRLSIDSSLKEKKILLNNYGLEEHNLWSTKKLTKHLKKGKLYHENIN